MREFVLPAVTFIFFTLFDRIEGKRKKKDKEVHKALVSHQVAHIIRTSSLTVAIFSNFVEKFDSK